MQAILSFFESTFRAVPLPLLEVWGRLSYVVGLALALYAYFGFTFRLGNGWGFGRERQAWDSKALLSIPLTFVLVTASGYLGSFIVLVPGAQTLESLKDLVVFHCIVLFGYPALLIVPFAYALADLIEGVPPEFLLDWLPGYFINPTFFWLGYQLLGKNPDLRNPRKLGFYLLFVVIFLMTEPVTWGYICAEKFTPEISYRSITPALFFTTGVTWMLSPFAMLGALPLARRFGLFWAEIDGHVRERPIGGESWVWRAGGGKTDEAPDEVPSALPIGVFILAPLIALVLVMVGVTAYVALRSAENDAMKLAERLHRETSRNIVLHLDRSFRALPLRRLVPTRPACASSCAAFRSRSTAERSSPIAPDACSRRPKPATTASSKPHAVRSRSGYVPAPRSPSISFASRTWSRSRSPARTGWPTSPRTIAASGGPNGS